MSSSRDDLPYHLTTQSRGLAHIFPMLNLKITEVAPKLSHCKMKGQWESNIKVWFPFMYSQKWNCYFQNRIIMFCLPVPTLKYLWEIYIFPGYVCLFCCRKICVPILGIYKSLTDTWIWKLGLRPRNSQKRNTKCDFPCSAVYYSVYVNELVSASGSVTVYGWECVHCSYYRCYLKDVLLPENLRAHLQLSV
jgi:hypothetical protein